MSDQTPGKNEHPWIDIRGPRADVPASGGAGPMPYGTDKHKPSTTVAVAGVGVVLLAGMGLAALTVDLPGQSVGPETREAKVESASEDRAPAEAGAAGSTTTEAERSTTTEAERTTTTTTTEPERTTTTSPSSSTSNIPVSKLPRHEAVYRDGKLILQGTVPSKEVQDRFRDEAAAVIGADNVIVRYQIDPRVPVPTDGRVRVDEDFLFPKNSAEIDPRYEPLMQLGVTVLKLNPQATMRIVGYTDDSGTAEVNRRLSTARANALRDYLMRNGIDGKRVEAVGKGEVDFVAPNDTEENRGKNRRIEVVLLDLLKE